MSLDRQAWQPDLVAAAAAARASAEASSSFMVFAKSSTCSHKGSVGSQGNTAAEQHSY
jgi:hypothetical protein